MSTADERTAYPDIPRVDVHTHIAGDRYTIDAYLRMREVSIQQHGVDLAMWVDLGGGDVPELDLRAALTASGGRVLSCLHDFSPHTGLALPPDQLPAKIEQGFLGYKIWAGPWQRALQPQDEGYRFIDDPAHEPTFARMEAEGIVGASIHIADPNGPHAERQQWLPDPVDYWRNIHAWRRVLDRHPKLQVINAHMCWLCCQDAQLDYLRNMLATFPGLNVDLAAVFQYFYLLDRDNLRQFMVRYDDRILFGTDISNVPDNQIAQRVEQYFHCFQILETDAVVPGGFFGQTPTKGLALPQDVLQKIYWRNAARIYPAVGVQLQSLGYERG
ncbi:MAG: amidohydrolase family protein [Gemmatimonadetes bacterium]|jgi:predicted TIM-barrel fold metal-dependent hydrolase|nr:amidohydrolase family protein [Gemmatimonadota bacterium]